MGWEQDQIRAALDAVDAAHTRLRSVCSDAVGNAFRVEVAERLETQHRVNRGLMYRFVGEAIDPPDGPEDPDLPAGSVTSKLLWQRLHVTAGEIRRRIRIAARIPRPTLTGSELAPELPHLAAAVEDGAVGDEHIAAICRALDVLPSAVPADQHDKAERVLVRHAKEQDATFVAVVRRRIAEVLNPDGLFDENDRARRRGLTLSPQGPDGMSRLTGWLDPEARASLDAVNAAVRPAATNPTPPTMSRPNPTPAPAPNACTTPSNSASRRPSRRASSDKHHGLPVTVIATTTLNELNQAAHAVTNPAIPMPPPARTGSGAVLPMRDLIRMAADAIHYLAVFDDHTNRPLYLGRTQRIATADQRIICHATAR